MQQVDELILELAKTLNIDGVGRVRRDHGHGAKGRLTSKLSVELLAEDREDLVDLLLGEDAVGNSHDLCHGNNAALLDLLSNVLLLQDREDFLVEHDSLVLERGIKSVKVNELSNEVACNAESVGHNLALTLEADDGAEELGNLVGMKLGRLRGIREIISVTEGSVQDLQRVSDKIVVVLVRALLDVRDEASVMFLEIVEHDHGENRQRLHGSNAHLDVVLRSHLLE